MEVLELMDTANRLVKLLDKQADSLLPKEIVDVVKLHSKLAVGASLIPVPGVDLAAGASAIWGMYIRINNKIGLKAKENVIKTIASGIATNLLSFVAAASIASSLKFIPGIGTVSGALIMGASQYAITLTAGWVYLKALCLLAERQGPQLDFAMLDKAVKEVLAQKSIVKDFFDKAKTIGKTQK